MSDFTTCEIATRKLRDGRTFIADEDIVAAGPEAMEFINRFTNYWQRDPVWRGWVSPPADDAKQKAGNPHGKS